MGLVALWHVGSSPTRARTHIPCIDRQILNHCDTREVPLCAFLVAVLGTTLYIHNVLPSLVSHFIDFSEVQTPPFISLYPPCCIYTRVHCFMRLLIPFLDRLMQWESRRKNIYRERRDCSEKCKAGPIGMHLFICLSNVYLALKMANQELLWWRSS